MFELRTASREQARERDTALYREAQESKFLIGRLERSAREFGELDAQTEGMLTEAKSRLEAITEERQAIAARFPNVGRKTSPNPLGKLPKKGNSMGVYSDDKAAEYASLHGIKPEQLSNGGFSSFGEFLSVYGSGRYDERVQELVSAASKFSSNGGVMVPSQFIAESLHPAGENELIMPRASVYGMTAGTLHVATLDNLDNTSGEMYGGFSAQWVAENGTFTEQTPETTSITLTRKKLGIFTVSSTELVSDSDYERQLIPALSQAMREFRDAAFFNGDGVGKPRGILNDAAIITVAKESGQAADTIVTTNLDKMYARIHPRLIRNCRWYANPTCIPQLLSLVRTIGTGGVSVPVLNEQNGSFSMYGLPVELTSKLPVVGDAGDILLADVSQYAVGMGPDVVIERSEHAKFQTGQICWRASWRGDGQGRWRTVNTPRNGDTLSWCVKLDSRA